MEAKGDIPERSRISLEIDSDRAPAEAVRKVSAVKTLAEDGNTDGHIYLPHTGEGEDYHIKPRNAYFFVDEGYIYWHANDKDRYVFGEDITMAEHHYED